MADIYPLDGALFRIMSVEVNACLDEFEDDTGNVTLSLTVPNEMAVTQCWYLKKKNEKPPFTYTFQNLLSDNYATLDTGKGAKVKSSPDPQEFTLEHFSSGYKVGQGPPQFTIQRQNRFIKPETQADRDKGSLTYNETITVFGSEEAPSTTGSGQTSFGWWFQPVNHDGFYGIYRFINKQTCTSLTLKDDESLVASQTVDGELNQYWVVEPAPKSAPVDNLYTIRNLKIPKYITFGGKNNLTVQSKLSKTNAYWYIEYDEDDMRNWPYVAVTNASNFDHTFSSSTFPASPYPSDAFPSKTARSFLEVQSGKKDDGTPVQCWFDNYAVANQRWLPLSVPLWSIWIQPPSTGGSTCQYYNITISIVQITLIQVSVTSEKVVQKVTLQPKQNQTFPLTKGRQYKAKVKYPSGNEVTHTVEHGAKHDIHEDPAKGSIKPRDEARK